LAAACRLLRKPKADEDKEMFNKAKQRDQQAIDDAVNGCGTAS